MRALAPAILAILTTLTLAACGKDACDPTGVFGCQQYTSDVTVTVENQLAEALAVDFDACVCCSKGDTKWQVAAHQTQSKEITVVDEGGGDGCDESAGLTNLTITSTRGSCRMSYDLKSVSVVCDDRGCDFGSLGQQDWR